MVAHIDFHDELKTALDDAEIPIGYDPRHRRMRLLVLPPGEAYRGADEFVPKSGARTVRLQFDPWTGVAFPGDLTEKWENIFRRQTGYYESRFAELDEYPPELTSDAWWIKRNIGRTNEVLKKGWKRPRLIRGAGIQEPRAILKREDAGTRPYHWVGNRVDVERYGKPGYARPTGHPPHMCEEMASEFDDPCVMIAYLPHVREYGIRRLKVGRPVDHQPLAIYPIRYCPWCGRKLPSSLRVKWEGELAKRGLSPDSPDIPKTFLTERWWLPPAKVPPPNVQKRTRQFGWFYM